MFCEKITWPITGIFDRPGIFRVFIGSIFSGDVGVPNTTL